MLLRAVRRIRTFQDDFDVILNVPLYFLLGVVDRCQIRPKDNCIAVFVNKRQKTFGDVQIGSQSVSSDEWSTLKANRLPHEDLFV